MTTSTRTLALVGLSAAALAACSSGDSTTEAIQGLTAPEGVELVEPDTTNVATGGSGLPNAGNAFPANSAYNTDVAKVRLYDKAFEAVDTANGILCEVGMTRFWEFTNLGPYIAQVDPSLCGNGGDGGQGDGQELLLHMFTLDVTRASNEVPQETNLWLPLNENTPTVTINAEIEVESGPTGTDRYGDFSLVYAGVPDGGTVANPAMFGVLTSDAGENGFRFLEGAGDTTVPATNPGDRAFLLQAAVVDNGDGTGAALIRQTTRFNNGGGDSGAQVTNWRIVYDQTHIKKQQDSGPEVVLSRNNYRDNVYSYNLYHNQGQNLGERVTVDSGISVRFTGGENGWVGFYGAWAEFPESFDNGDVVTDTDDNQYTVVQAPGRLLRYQEETLSLAQITDQPFEWWDGGTRYRVAYSGVEWQRLAQWNDGTSQWDAITPPTMIDVAGIGGFLGMWSQSLGPVSYIDGAAGIDYFQRDVLLGNDAIFANGAVEFFATIQGLRSAIDLTQANNGDIYLPTVAPGSAHRYVLDPANMTLMHDVNGDGSVMTPAGLAANVEPNSGPNQWGMQSGRMVGTAAIGGMTNADDIWQESTFYVYETGHNDWNQLVALVDGQSNYLSFDRPLEFLYTHATANDINGDATFDGYQSLMTYNGPGRMWGIPGEETDADGDGTIDQWFPSYSIADGTTMGPTGGEYILRAIGVDQTLTVDPGAGGTLTLTDADALTIPSISLYVTPQIGTQPDVTDPPAVIDGVIQ